MPCKKEAGLHWGSVSRGPKASLKPNASLTLCRLFNCLYQVHFLVVQCSALYHKRCWPNSSCASRRHWAQLIGDSSWRLDGWREGDSQVIHLPSSPSQVAFWQQPKLSGFSPASSPFGILVNPRSRVLVIRHLPLFSLPIFRLSPCPLVTWLGWCLLDYPF